MSTEDMIKHYEVQLKKYSETDLIKINNYIESNNRYMQRLIWPYEEHIMKRILDWDKHYSVLESIEIFAQKYVKDLSYGIPFKDFDKNAVVVVYKTKKGVENFWFLPEGIYQDANDIIESLAINLTGYSKEDLIQLNDDLGLSDKQPLVWYDSVVEKEDEDNEKD